MRRVLASAACWALAGWFAGAAVAQTPAAPPRETLASLAPALHPTVRQRSMHFYRMPDGTIWDGWQAAEYRRILSRCLKPLDKIEREHAAPGTTFAEDKVVGTAWRISPLPEVKAWDLPARLGDERGEVQEQGIENADPRTWTDAPPLWSSLQGRDFSWEFALVDEDHPDEYTRATHKNYLEITTAWGDDRYEFKGHTLDRGPVYGLVSVPDSRLWVRKDRFKGVFFLWPDGYADQPGGVNRPAWRLIPADELRMTPDDLADALISGKAELVTWTRERIRDDKYLWKRSTRQIDLAAPPAPKPDPEPRKPTPPPITGGPDLVILKDGRWFRGQVTRRDETSVTIRTPFGQMEAEMTFKMDEVKEVQTPEKR
jgi:hypothetical protein